MFGSFHYKVAALLFWTYLVVRATFKIQFCHSTSSIITRWTKNMLSAHMEIEGHDILKPKLRFIVIESYELLYNDLRIIDQMQATAYDATHEQVLAFFRDGSNWALVNIHSRFNPLFHWWRLLVMRYNNSTRLCRIATTDIALTTLKCISCIPSKTIKNSQSRVKLKYLGARTQDHFNFRIYYRIISISMAIKCNKINPKNKTLMIFYYYYCYKKISLYISDINCTFCILTIVVYNN